MAKFKIVVTDFEFEDLSIEEKIISQLDANFIKANHQKEDDLIELTRNADAVINQYSSINKKIISEMRQCKVISRYGVGVDTIDLEAANSKGIQVCNVPDYGVEEVSIHTLALLLSWSRKIPQLNNHVKKGNWDFKLGVPIYRYTKQTLGVYGFGRIPQSLVRKAREFYFDILVHDPFIDEETIRSFGAKPVSLEEMFKKSDFVSVHVPLTKETKHIINYNVFKIMKKNAIIINTARGPIINETDLIVALEEKKIAGAALDVLEQEPIADNHRLLDFENVILTPHSAFYSEESLVELRTKTAQNVVDVLKDKKPAYLVNNPVLI